jgi:hypothetical protein
MEFEVNLIHLLHDIFMAFEFQLLIANEPHFDKAMFIKAIERFRTVDINLAKSQSLMTTNKTLVIGGKNHVSRFGRVLPK